MGKFSTAKNNLSFERFFCHVLCLLLLAIKLSLCDEEIDLTFEVDPAKKECFYHDIKQNVDYEVDFQVIEGGDLDISMLVQDPAGKTIVFDNKKSENFHQLNSGDVEGTYVFCMDNTFSRFSPKLVNLQIIVEDDVEDDLKADYDFEGVYSTKIESFKQAVQTTKKNLEESLQALRYLKSVEARDRSIAEHNFERVNFWSLIHVIVMVSAGLTQVLMIRSLFSDGKGRLSKILNAPT